MYGGSSLCSRMMPMLPDKMKVQCKVRLPFASSDDGGDTGGEVSLSARAKYASSGSYMNHL